MPPLAERPAESPSSETRDSVVRPNAGNTRGPVALAAKGFRPFFLLASALAALIAPLWILMFLGRLRLPHYIGGVGWHAHEMLFGFAVAVIAGFLLTAVGNWTQRETATGLPLLGLCALWVAGRLAIAFAGLLPRGLPALVDAAFLPLLAVVLGRPLLRARNRRNFVMLGILGLLFAANTCMHLEALGLLPTGSARTASLGAVNLTVLLILIIAGRVLPMFTRNATGVSSIRSIPALEVLTTSGMGCLIVLDLWVPSSTAAAVVAGLVGLFAALRAAQWGTRHTFGQPLLWILHAGYAWIPLGLTLRFAAHFGVATPGPIWIHALTVGAIGSLTLGMMTRVSLGHTGRALVTSRAMSFAFAAVTLAALARVAVPLVAPAWYIPGLITSAALWSFAFVVFFLTYLPALSQPRIDGKPG